MPDTTKNGDGRVFPMTDDLRTLLEAQHDEHRRAEEGRHDRAVGVLPDGGREARRREEAAADQGFTKAWKAACVAAGCPVASRTTCAGPRPQYGPPRCP